MEVFSACHVPEPCLLNSIWPPARPEILSVTATEMSVGSDDGEVSKASSGGSGSKRSVIGTEALAGS